MSERLFYGIWLYPYHSFLAMHLFLSTFLPALQITWVVSKPPGLRIHFSLFLSLFLSHFLTLFLALFVSLAGSADATISALPLADPPPPTEQELLDALLQPAVLPEAIAAEDVLVEAGDGTLIVMQFPDAEVKGALQSHFDDP